MNLLKSFFCLLPIACCLLFSSCGMNEREKRFKQMEDSLEAAMKMQVYQDSLKAAQQYENRWKVLSAFETLKYEKRFAFYCMQDCYDALYTEEYNSSVPHGKPYSMNSSRDEDSLYVVFNVRDACYQQFIGDYKLENDTLKLVYSKLAFTEEDCHCEYRYVFSIDPDKRRWKAITINGELLDE